MIDMIEYIISGAPIAGDPIAGDLIAGDPIAFAELYRAFWARDPSVLQATITASNARQLSLWIVVLAGLSEELGHSFILFVHRVRPVRFLISLLLAASLFALNFLLWVSTVWLLSTLLPIEPISWRILRTAVAISYVPLLLGFLTFLPYLGYPLSHLLHAFSFIALVRILGLVTEMSGPQALFCAAVGYMLVLLSRATIGKPLIWAEKRLRNFVAGSDLEMDFNHMLANLPPAQKYPDRKHPDRK